ncbi:MAG: hypothetical protein ABIL70_05125 [candidate division WOR-3 bacterium]
MRANDIVRVLGKTKLLLKNLLAIILVTLLILPNTVWSNNHKAESWVYASVLDGTIGPIFSYFLNLGVGRCAFGLPHPLSRFGIGAGVIDGFIVYEPSEVSGVYLPVSIYYLPYARWNTLGFGAPVIYTSVTTNLWPVNHNYHYLMPRVGISFFCVGVELGLGIALKHFSVWGFQGGIKLSLGGWFGPKTSKLSGKGEE